jgi:hypothetical protein
MQEIDSFGSLRQLQVLYGWGCNLLVSAVV